MVKDRESESTPTKSVMLIDAYSDKLFTLPFLGYSLIIKSLYDKILKKILE